MCGICGFAGNLASQKANVDKKNERSAVVQAMLDTIRHRGPDGMRIAELPGAALGFCRLSIIDLAGGMQPMPNEDKNKTLVFNGEIYNYQDLQKELTEKGHTFATRSDSESILHGYEEYGEDVTSHLRGMFAFAIWDEKEQKLFAARDYFGIKPFYYALIDGCFVFASEIKAILKFPGYQKTLNKKALEGYLSFQFSPYEETLFSGIYRLLPGHSLTYENGKITVKRYFDPVLSPDDDLSPEQAVASLRTALQDSVKAHMIADVEVGAFLSGGVDSSYIAATFTGKKSFSVGFMGNEGQYSELSKAKALADIKGLENYSHIITTEEFWEAMPRVMYYLDEPSGDAAAVALYFVAREAAKYVKVVTSGEGSDEFFGGYQIYHEPLDVNRLSWLPKEARSALGRLARHLPEGMKGRGYLLRASKDVESRFIGNAHIFTTEERREILLEDTGAPSNKDFLREEYQKCQGVTDTEKMQYIDILNWLPGDILQKADRMSMAHSLEVRVPFLDKVVFEAARHLPLKAKIVGNETKWAFRQAAREVLPEEVSDRAKLGFPVPIRVWLKEEPYVSLVKEAFTSRTAKSLFHTDKLLSLLEEHKEGKKDNSRKIWTVYVLLVWHRIFFEDGMNGLFA